MTIVFYKSFRRWLQIIILVRFNWMLLVEYYIIVFRGTEKEQDVRFGLEGSFSMLETIDQELDLQELSNVASGVIYSKSLMGSAPFE